MPIYVYKNPDTEEYKEIIQTMSEDHVYSEGDVEWKRVFTVPNASIDTQISAFDRNGFIDKTGKMKGTVGDVLDYSAELSEKRADERGEDPVKRQMYNDYEKKTGKKHIADKEKVIDSSSVKIEL